MMPGAQRKPLTRPRRIPGTPAEACDLPNKPGALAQCLAKLAAKGVNLNSIHATAAKGGKKAVIVYTAEAAAKTATASA